MRINFRNGSKCKLYCWSHKLKFGILWGVLLIFIISSIYFLSPAKDVEHDRGLMSSELTRVETTKENVTRISYVNSSGEITYAVDKQCAILVQTKDEQGQLLEEYYLDTDEKPTEHYGYFRVSYEHKDKEDILKYFDVSGNLTKTISGYSIIVRSFDDTGQAVDEMYYDADMNPQMCTGDYYGVHREYSQEKLADDLVYLNIDGTPTSKTNGVAREKRIFDKEGRVVRTLFFDLDNNPIRLPAGQEGEAYTYDENGRIIQITYLDQNGNPTETTSGYTILKKSYYCDGTEKTNMYFDASGNPVSLSKGQYGTKRVGDLTLYLNKNGQVMLCLDNLLNGYPFMVVIVGLLLCLFLCFAPRRLQTFTLLFYTLFIFYETLMFRETGNTRANLVLFSYADTFLSNWKVRVDTINNVWLFVPFGTGLYVIFRKKKVWIAAFILSVSIELIQYFTGLGIAELDDLFGNTLGGVIGVGVGVAVLYGIDRKQSMSKERMKHST